jgi:2,3-bisphosphoglycerate-independent phosphoglycerate mutase
MSSSFPLVALVILDGFGCAPAGPGNAVELADTPVFDRFWREYPHTTIDASGEAAGLPPGQMGNSEVGHLTIGSGRRLDQDLMRVNKSIADGSFFENETLRGAFERGKRVHVMGLVSHGGVHSHIDHVQALLKFAPEKTWIHAFTDGRDVSPTSAVRDLALLPQDRIATIVGRYYAMDRDKRWDRTQRAYDAITRAACTSTVAPGDLLAAVQRGYDSGVTDEFIEPICVEGAPGLGPGDTVIFFNFRPDRGRQLTRLLLDNDFDVTTLTRYAGDLDTHVVFEERKVENTLAQVLSSHGLRQLHAAETEKYAHVTYFFNGGREEAWPGEERILVPSPRDVPSYDHKPEMSADEVTDQVCAKLDDTFAFLVVNFANPDMVGHTGVIPAAITACETTDRCLGRIVARVQELGGVCLVTADQGNAEQLLEADGVSPQTAHTTNPVPVVLTTPDGELRRGGEIADLAPTILALLGIERPPEMTGTPLTAG